MIEVWYTRKRLGELKVGDTVVGAARRWEVVRVDKEWRRDEVRIHAEAMLLGDFPRENEVVMIDGDSDDPVDVERPELFADRMMHQHVGHASERAAFERVGVTLR